MIDEVKDNTLTPTKCTTDNLLLTSPEISRRKSMPALRFRSKKSQLSEEVRIMIYILFFSIVTNIINFFAKTCNNCNQINNNVKIYK